MTLSCVPTVKRLIKHLYLPLIHNLWAPFFTFKSMLSSVYMFTIDLSLPIVQSL